MSTIIQAPSASLAVAQGPAAQPADPWDAPYFGAPVYFRYPDYPVGVADLKASAPTRASVPSAGASAVPVAVPPPVTVAPQGVSSSLEAPTANPLPARRGFFARLFGRR